MAVSYAAKVYANDKFFFLKLLFRWTGSVWKLLWMDFLIYVLIYILMALFYRLYLRNDIIMLAQFEMIAKWISLLRSGVPLSFLLGFFVSNVLSRWWSLCLIVPWLNTPAFFSQALIQGGERYGDLARKIRLTILRYMNLSWILVMGDISMQVKNRFNFKKKSTYWSGKVSKNYKLTWRERLNLINKDSKVKKYFGTLVTEAEMEGFAASAELSHDDDYSYSPEYWLPLAWASRLLLKGHKIGCIEDDRHLMRLVEMVAGFRGSLGTLWTYAEFSIPFVYTQVATLAVYIYILSGLFSSHLAENNILSSASTIAKLGNRTIFFADDTKSPLIYIPLVGAFEFIFYLGWFKIGMCLINPLGEDEEDVPLSDILNSNLKISVKCGGSENCVYPCGMAEYGVPEEQIIRLITQFDFSKIHAHDKFESPEETEARIKAEMLRKQKKKMHKKMATQVSYDSKDSTEVKSVPEQTGVKSKLKKNKLHKGLTGSKLSVNTNSPTLSANNSPMPGSDFDVFKLAFSALPGGKGSNGHLNSNGNKNKVTPHPHEHSHDDKKLHVMCKILGTHKKHAQQQAKAKQSLRRSSSVQELDQYIKSHGLFNSTEQFANADNNVRSNVSINIIEPSSNNLELPTADPVVTWTENEVDYDLQGNEVNETASLTEPQVGFMGIDNPSFDEDKPLKNQTMVLKRMDSV